MMEPLNRSSVKRIAGKIGMARGTTLRQRSSAIVPERKPVFACAVHVPRAYLLRCCSFRKAIITPTWNLFRSSLRQQRGMIDAKSFRHAKHEIHILYRLSRCALDQIIRYH